MNITVFVFGVLALRIGPEATGCGKDTDCKGDRICDAATGACIDPVAPVEVAPVEVAPVEVASVNESLEAGPEPGTEAPAEREPTTAQASEYELPPGTTRTTRTTRTAGPRRVEYRPTVSGSAARVHPYVGGGVLVLVFGLGATIGGAALLGVHTSRLTSGNFDAVTTATTNIPRVYVGATVLISSGIVLVVTGIVLAAITDDQRVAVGPDGIGLAF